MQTYLFFLPPTIVVVTGRVRARRPRGIARARAPRGSRAPRFRPPASVVD